MIPIVVSKHAMDRMRERFPAVRAPEKVVLREVSDAIEAGRRSTTRPVWASTFSRGKGHNARFVWNEDQSRCFVIVRKRIAGKGQGWLVVTTLSRGDPVMMERMVWAKGEPNQTRTGPHSPKSGRVWRRGRQ